MSSDLFDTVRSAVASDDFSGIALLRRGDETVLEAVNGVARRHDGTAVSASTRFDTAGITAAFTTVAVLRRVEAGDLDLDLPVGHYRRDLDWLPGEVTLLHLLTHTSGVADEVDEAAGESYEEFAARVPLDQLLTGADRMAHFRDRTPRHAPGAGIGYSDAAIVVAGLVLEAVAKADVREVIERDVFATAGMASSGFIDRRTLPLDAAEGWDAAVGGRSTVGDQPPVGGADAGAYSTAADLVAFSEALREGRLIGDELRDEMLSPQVITDDEVYGLGVAIDLSEAGAQRSWYVDGIAPGASGILRHYEAEGVDVVVLSNVEDAAWPVIQEIDAHFAD